MARARLEAVRRTAARTPARALRDEAEARRGDRRPFAGALRRAEGERLRVIAELKRASPSAGEIRAAMEPASIARAYEESGAAALSILTEPTSFRGSIEDLAFAREAVRIPALLKDFIVDEWQLYEARARGADAALLIVALLGRSQLRDYAALAKAIDLEIFLEIHDERELERALEVEGAIGVNNRDLRSLEVRRGRAEALVPRIPAERVRVGESGYMTAEDLEGLVRAGADAALIGESLLRSDDPGAALQALLKALTREAEGRSR